MAMPGLLRAGISTMPAVPRSRAGAEGSGILVANNAVVSAQIKATGERTRTDALKVCGCWSVHVDGRCWEAGGQAFYRRAPTAPFAAAAPQKMTPGKEGSSVTARAKPQLRPQRDRTAKLSTSATTKTTSFAIARAGSVTRRHTEHVDHRHQRRRPNSTSTTPSVLASGRADPPVELVRPVSRRKRDLEHPTEAVALDGKLVVRAAVQSAKRPVRSDQLPRLGRIFFLFFPILRHWLTFRFGLIIALTFYAGGTFTALDLQKWRLHSFICG
ncbi:hypothetical protein MAPG_11145 [Magnaporthiopsis poae ATCC 64411]|uniref:Uncharacterized protein n=1 Tax=Magnaporthiopsis poae (strain ATCC 64411 / 73-15) TaxID=644358 RepID=A0A0C4EEH2_MAGP6|nr:hypothetical protein MAPG_11145 [Magnaporthiopsis poae ATCC 64411]